ncbi:4Fe-4S dicluster domain-containing protein [Chloroflexota bacterium]
MTVINDKESCTRCCFCLLLCPQEAIELIPAAFVLNINDDRCNDCLECIDCCPSDALREV